MNVQQGAQASTDSVRGAVETLLIHTSSCAFMSKEEGDKMMTLMQRRASEDGAAGEKVSSAGEPLSPVDTSETTRGLKATK